MPGGNIFHRDLQWPFAEHAADEGRWGVETAHPNVFLCGAGARRGGGVSAIPGRNAAMAAPPPDPGSHPSVSSHRCLLRGGPAEHSDAGRPGQAQVSRGRRASAAR